MKTLIRDISFLVTLDREQSETSGGYLYTDGPRIAAVGKGEPPPEIEHAAEMCVFGRDRIALPGFVNTHHHFYQTLFRNVREVQSAKLFDWLVFLYERWQRIDEEAVYQSSLVAMLEMLQSGVTTTSDHHYIFPRGHEQLIDVQIQAARRLGVRFHPTRGSMSLSREDGGLPPPTVVQREEEILLDSERLIRTYHDRSPLAMTRIALAPCSPFSVTARLMKESRDLAEREDVLLHTHLAETEDEDRFCREKFGRGPLEYMEDLGWLSDRVWFAHFIHLSREDQAKAARARVGMSYCPSSNMRLGSGVAPVAPLVGSGVRQSMGIDGSASNDANNMLAELRTGLLLQRLRYGADAMTPRQMLRIGTLGGAEVLGRGQEIGSLEVGKAADLIMVRLDTLAMAGGLDDPPAALLLCDAKQVDFAMVNGEILIRDGQFTRIPPAELEEIIRAQNDLSRRLVRGL